MKGYKKGIQKQHPKNVAKTAPKTPKNITILKNNNNNHNNNNNIKINNSSPK